MANALTLIAEEIARAVALIWGGIGIAVKLNYEVMSVVVTLMARIVQLLLLLTQKASDVITILSDDILLFLADVGHGAIAIGNTTHSFISGVVNTVSILGSACLAALFHIYACFESACHSVTDMVTGLTVQFGHLIQLIKYSIILFGSSTLFTISLLPKLMYLVCEGVRYIFINVQHMFVNIINSLEGQIRYGLQSTIKTSVNYVTSMPLGTLFGTIIGVLFIISMHFLIRYMVDNLVIIPNFHISSFATNVRQRLSRWFVCLWQETLAQPPRESGVVEQNIDNSRTNNSDIHITNQSDRLSVQENRRESIRNVGDGSTLQPSISRPNNYLHSGEHLTRRPLSRRQRVIGLTEDEVTKTKATSRSEDISRGPDKFLDESIKQLYRELEEERDNKLCIICHDKPKRIILLPCKHLCLCDVCRSAVISRTNSCPVCRKVITDTMAVYV